MNEIDFSKKYMDESPIFKAWGEFVLSTILDRLPHDFKKKCIKIEPKYRLKELDSMLNKAFITKKRKYDEITDKVGMRFVVLLTDQILIIQKIIESNTTDWDASEDRELEDWRRTNTPNSFDYQSVHYILYAKADINYHGITITKGTPCEVQIRTLLQHAYAEMAHDNTYKTEQTIPKEVYRYLAKSMALMETTDEILSKANKCILDNNAVLNDWKYAISKLAKDNLINISAYGTDYILNQLREIIIDTSTNNKHSIEEFEKYIYDNKSIVDEIRSRSQYLIGFREETILIIFYFVSLYHRKIKRIELFDERTVMKYVYSILGYAYNDMS
ncbi:RelA/SpoT domain-containing protein [Wohlfahrtiimonas chitiniclastica]|uniref:RelA/SpoT domain-containing protein n=1 Tax=Wohlfahrtiimonas chitiniclastica TaxID=400946 RepID=UPI0021584AD6|nr:RelA/SpoT domain-containing protein [Wohlfahrtiimonas chitiniclastica]MDC7251613.1 hypothetical protein [Wohlfahrtiimonas chitiniclastica]